MGWCKITDLSSMTFLVLESSSVFNLTDIIAFLIDMFSICSYFG